MDHNRGVDVSSGIQAVNGMAIGGQNVNEDVTDMASSELLLVDAVYLRLLSR
jgi:hypothetical protein